MPIAKIMEEFVKPTLVLLLLTISGISVAVGQNIVGHLEGRVVDARSRPIAGVNVSVSGEVMQGVRGAFTDAKGWFHVLALPPGSYTVRIGHLAYYPQEFSSVTILLGKTSTLGVVTMQTQVLQLPQVVVMGTRPVIDFTTTDEGGTLTSRTIEQLPIERNYRAMVAVLPQANFSYLGDEINMSGATGLENKYFIDGMEVTDPLAGGTGTNLPYNFIREVEVKTGGYQAEYRSTLGGLVNVITHSGGDEFHGQVFGFFADNRIAAEPRQPQAQLSQGDYAQYDVGFRLGGPLLRERLWFFAAYNPTIDREEVLIPGLGYYSDRSTIHSFAGKLTWQAGRRNNLVFTLLGDPQVRRGVGELFGTWGLVSSLANPDPYLGEINRGGINLSLNGRHDMGKKTLLESQASWVTRQERNVPATTWGRTEPLFSDENGRWSGGAPSQIDSRSNVFTIGLKLSHRAGRHDLKCGLEYRNNQLNHETKSSALSRVGQDTYSQFMARAHGTVNNRQPGAFIQDSWQVGTRINIQAGLRWDGQYFIASTGKVVQTITDQFQPRVGVVFQPGKNAAQKVQLFYGRFYQELSTFLSQAYFLSGALMSFKMYSHDPRIDPSNPDQAFEFVTSIRPALKNLQGQYYDSFSLGYEQTLFRTYKLGIYGALHTLRQGIEDGFDPETGDAWFHNPGKGVLKQYPRVKREYQALEFRIEKPYDGRFGLLASYVLSKTSGNYPGLFNSDFNFSAPNVNASFDQLETLTNGTGRLPNDRTHVFKISGSVHLLKGLQAGTFLVWQSGTPLNEFGGSSAGMPWYRFMQPRGSAGRTLSLWDLNLRLAYDFGASGGSGLNPRLILDAFHVGSRRTPVNYEQIHYYSLDENGQNINANPFYGQPSHFQPPMALRLGMEVNF
jgi:hypothetical protein